MFLFPIALFPITTSQQSQPSRICGVFDLLVHHVITSRSMEDGKPYARNLLFWRGSWLQVPVIQGISRAVSNQSLWVQQSVEATKNDPDLAVVIFGFSQMPMKTLK